MTLGHVGDCGEKRDERESCSFCVMKWFSVAWKMNEEAITSGWCERKEEINIERQQGAEER